MWWDIPVHFVYGDVGVFFVFCRIIWTGGGDAREYRYNLIPFVEIRRFWMYREQVGNFAMILNIFGNVVGFVPFGYILPVINDRFRNWLLIVVSGFSLSLCVETAQLIFRVGSFDVDDLLLNTLGALLGYVSFWVCNEVRRRL